MSILAYILLGVVGLGMVYLLHKRPQLAVPALVVAAAVGVAILLLGR